MEKNIKRVEKLVHATNSALAQMKFSLMFDDMNAEARAKPRRKESFESLFLDKLLEEDDLKQCQSQFRAEASDMIEKMDKLLAGHETKRKNTRALNRIKEINQKMNHLKLDQSKPVETEQSRQKLMSLMSEEKFSPGNQSEKDSLKSIQTVISNINKRDSWEKLLKSESGVSSSKSPVKPKAELKNKILETQEIVDRGFKTARQLAQKVESLSKLEKTVKTPPLEKTVSEINIRRLEGKSESNETMKSVKSRRHCGERKNKKQVEVNSKVIEMRGKEIRKHSKAKLEMQRLPSVHIRDGLSVQSIHNLEIPAVVEKSDSKLNTCVSYLSHEQMQKEKMEKTLENIRKENRCCMEDKIHKSYIECFNCGKIIQVQESFVDPQKIDDILVKCNFNVMDPRIDEFVEKHGNSVNFNEETQPEPQPPPPISPKPAKHQTEPQEKPIENYPASKKDHYSLQEFCDEVLEKYKEEIESLEDNHMKIDYILQSLFKKVDESREVFEDCHLLKSHRLSSNLIATKPVLIEVGGNRIKEKLDKKDVKNRYKSRTMLRSKKEVTTAVISSKAEAQNSTKLPSVTRTVCEGKKKELGKKKFENFTFVDADSKAQGVTSSCSSSSSEKIPSVEQERQKVIADAVRLPGELKPTSSIFRKQATTDIIKRNNEIKRTKTSSDSSVESRPIFKPKVVEEITAPPINLTSTFPLAESEKKDSSKENSEISSQKTEVNYESDFESVTNEPDERADDWKDEIPEAVPVLNKLSTILEVDSELEKKTPRSGQDDTLRHLSKSEDNSESLRSKKADVSSKTPTELVTSLKDILSALQSQFAKTENLAEKLTEDAKVDKRKDEPEFIGSPWKLPPDVDLVETLQSTRRDSNKDLTLAEDLNIVRERSKSSGSLSENGGGSSIGEVIVSEKTSDVSSISEVSFLKLEPTERSAHS